MLVFLLACNPASVALDAADTADTGDTGEPEKAYLSADPSPVEVTYTDSLITTCERGGEDRFGYDVMETSVRITSLYGAPLNLMEHADQGAEDCVNPGTPQVAVHGGQFAWTLDAGATIEYDLRVCIACTPDEIPARGEHDLSVDFDVEMESGAILPEFSIPVIVNL